MLRPRCYLMNNEDGEISATGLNFKGLYSASKKIPKNSPKIPIWWTILSCDGISHAVMWWTFTCFFGHFILTLVNAYIDYCTSISVITVYLCSEANYEPMKERVSMVNGSATIPRRTAKNILNSERIHFRKSNEIKLVWD